MGKPKTTHAEQKKRKKKRKSRKEQNKQTVITVVPIWLSSCVFKVRWIDESFLRGSLRTIKELSAGRSPKCHTSRLKNSWHHPAWCWLRHRIYTAAHIATALASGPSLCSECTPNLYYMHWKPSFPNTRSICGGKKKKNLYKCAANALWKSVNALCK